MEQEAVVVGARLPGPHLPARANTPSGGGAIGRGLYAGRYTQGWNRRGQGGRHPRLRCRTLQQWLRGMPLRVSGGWARAEAGIAAWPLLGVRRKRVDRR